MTDYGHIAAFAFVGPFGRVFLGNDLDGVDIQGVGRASELAQMLGHDPAMDAKSRAATARAQTVYLGIAVFTGCTFFTVGAIVGMLLG